jgi:DNA-directed RNA polymerase specialized sigma subunit
VNIRKIFEKAVLHEDDIITILLCYKYSWSILLNYARVFLYLEDGTIRTETSKIRNVSFEDLIRRNQIKKMSTGYKIIIIVDYWFQFLTEDEKKVIFYRYVDTEWNKMDLRYEGMSHREIGKKIKCSVSNCFRLEKKAIKKILILEGFKIDGSF